MYNAHYHMKSIERYVKILFVCLIIFLTLLSIVLFASSAHAQNVEIEDSQYIPRLIAEQALINGIDVHMALYVSYQESQWQVSAIGDTQLTCKSTGLPMKSRGIWQWNTCGHSDISDAMAFDPLISTQLAMKEMKLNGCKIWSVCNTPILKE